ncbi:MAG: adenosylcobinamide hydrolase [Thermoanaerobacter sp.]|nr:adenosylcobinamide hydrolase [Thermoanaerobacter sp.]
MLIYETSSGEKIYRRDDSIIVYFPGPRRVVSTARLNGGYREDLQAVFNHHIPPGDHKPADLPGGSVEGYLEYPNGFPALLPVTLSGGQKSWTCMW